MKMHFMVVHEGIVIATFRTRLNHRKKAFNWLYLYIASQNFSSIDH